jgi:hypothetical protein
MRNLRVGFMPMHEQAIYGFMYGEPCIELCVSRIVIWFAIRIARNPSCEILAIWIAVQVTRPPFSELD